MWWGQAATESCAALGDTTAPTNAMAAMASTTSNRLIISCSFLIGSKCVAVSVAVPVFKVIDC